MTGKTHRHPHRRVWHCRYDHYYLPTSRDRSCAHVTQHDRAAVGTDVTQCGRNRLLATMPLLAAENLFAGPWCVLRPNGLRRG